MCDFPSPSREDRIQEFPDTSSEHQKSLSSNSTGRLRERKLRNSVGTSDLTTSRASFADSVSSNGEEDAETRDHFTVETIMVTWKETEDSVRLSSALYCASFTCVDLFAATPDQPVHCGRNDWPGMLSSLPMICKVI